MVLKACSQTGHYTPQSSTVWVRVGECVCERIGRCSPPRWKCPKISQQQICHLHNCSFLFFHKFKFFFAFFYIERVCYRPTRCKRRQQPGQQNASQTVTLWFGDAALERRGTGNRAQPCPCHRAAPNTVDHILCQHCKQRWNTQRRAGSVHNSHLTGVP